MIVRKPFVLAEHHPYAYAGKPNTCKWCGLKLPKLWYHGDYTVVGWKDKKPYTKELKAQVTMQGMPVDTLVPRPVWAIKSDAPERKRGFPVTYSDQAIGDCDGNGHFCYLACAIAYALAVASTDMYPLPQVDSTIRTRRALKGVASYVKRKL